MSIYIITNIVLLSAYGGNDVKFGHPPFSCYHLRLKSFVLFNNKNWEIVSTANFVLLGMTKISKASNITRVISAIEKSTILTA